MATDRSHFTALHKDGICFVEFEDRKILDELSISEIGEQLQVLSQEHRPINLVLNFKNVQHLSSAALGMLITLHKTVSDQSGQLKLSNINAQIFEVFKITQLHRMFDVYDNAAAAKASFAQQR